VTDSLFDLGWHSGAPESIAALGAARLGPGYASAHPLDNHRTLEQGVRFIRRAGGDLDAPCSPIQNRSEKRA
jgi:hypothetical protein